MRKLLFALLASVPCTALAVDCIPSGVTDQFTYFVAVDATDFTTRETGLSTFTVRRSRNGAASAAFTTPTVNETDTTNMPGVYELLLDEDMTIDAGDDVQHMTLHITATGMAPVTKEICIARSKITAGNTLAVASDGDLTEVNTLTGHTAQTGDAFARLGAPAGASVSADIAAVEGQTDDIGTAGAGLTNIDLPNQTMDITGTLSTVTSVTNLVTANMTQVSGDSGAADELELAFDGATGAVESLGIARQGTAQSATGTTLVLDASAPFADDTAIGMTLVACGSTQGYCQSRGITDYVTATDTATVETWTVTPSGTITYYVFATAPSSGGGGGLDAAGVRAAVGLASANLDTQLTAIDDAVDTEVAAILVDTGTTLDDLVDDLETRLGTPANLGGGATVAGNLSDIEGFADNLPTDPADDSDIDAQLVAIDDFIDTEIATLTTRLGTPTDFGSGTSSIAANLQDLADNGTATFDRATDSLQAIRDRGDAAWTGGGGGTADWTADERTAIAAILGIPLSGTTPADPTDGILDDIRDSVATRASQASVDAVDDFVDGVETGIAVLNDVSTGEVQTAAAAALTAYDPPTRAELTSDIDGLLASQRIITGTCDSGSTTTCVDNALTQAAASQLEGRLVCFDDSWCALITTFAPGSDTATTTKVAPSTRASRAYTIFPSTLE